MNKFTNSDNRYQWNIFKEIVPIDVKTVIEIAKTSINEIILNNNTWLPDINLNKYLDLQDKQGAFTTLYSFNEVKELRGCIGLPYPQHPLAEAIAISSRNSATKDPRFPPVSIIELDNIVIEVEVLSPITKISYDSIDELTDQIKVGVHGLIVQYHDNTGLLLPKVGSRYNWSSLELIKNTCRKAMLPLEAYTWDEIEFHKFTSDLFVEN